MHQEFHDLSQAKARLHLSESPFKLPDRFRKAMEEELLSANNYPEPGSVNAINALSQYWNMSPDNIIIGNGCDEVILYTFLKHGRNGRVLINQNTYPGYREIADLANQEIQEIPLKEWRVDLDSFEQAINSRTKIIVICNPHNPTGSILSRAYLKEFTERCSNKGIIVVVDEAYSAFAKQENSLVHCVDEHENLIIWKSFAKSHGLAGIRLGAAIGSKRLMLSMKQASESNPFSVNRLAQRMVQEIAVDDKPFQEQCKVISARRDFVQSQLSELGVWHNPSNTNFIFLKAPEGMTGKTFFQETGVFVRDCEGYNLPGYWRVSCGTSDEMKVFISGISHFKPK